MLLNPLALLGPALTKMLPSLLGGGSAAAGGAAGAAGGSGGSLGGMLSGLFGGGGASGGLSRSLSGFFGKSSGSASALSAGEIESMLAEGAFSSASGIFEASDEETSSLIRGSAGGGETSFDANTGQAEARSHAAESAAAARRRRTEAGSISGSAGGGFEGMAADALGNHGDSGGSLMGQAILAGAAATGISKITGTAGALFSAPLQVADSIMPDGNLKNAANAGTSAASGLAKAAWSGITMDPQGWVEGMTQFTVGVIEGAKQLREFAKGVAEGNRKLGDYNGNVALADATLEVNRIRRDIEFAQETGGSAAQTIRSEDRLEDSLKEFNQSIATLQNVLSIGVNEVVRIGVEVAKYDPMFQVYGRVLEALEKQFPNAAASDLNEVFRRIEVEAQRRAEANRRDLT